MVCVMKQYDFDTVIERTGTRCVKWDWIEKEGQEVFPLWVADMDFACADAIVEAMHQQVDARIYGYNTGFDQAYRESVCSWFQHRFDWHIEPKTIFFAGGVVPAIAYLLEILSEEGDGILIQTPVYHPFRKKIEATKRRVIENPLLNQGGIYTIDFEDLEEKLLRTDVKGMILCSPHNPVGRVWTAEELRKLVDIAKHSGKWIISDEIHCDIIREENTQIPLLKLAPDYAEQIITCTAPSKTFNLAGLQNSNIIIVNRTYQVRWRRFVEERLSIGGPNSFAISSTMAAYQHGEEWLDQVNTYIDENIHFATAFLKEHLPEAIVSPCEGTYLLWVDMRAYETDAKSLEERLKAHGIIFNQGYIFGQEGAGFVRMNLACSRNLLQRCLSVFAGIFN